MEASSEAYLRYLRSLHRDDYIWDADVPFGHECSAGDDCRFSNVADGYHDGVHCIRNV